MLAQEIIGGFAVRHITVSLNGAGGLSVAPASRLTDEDRQAIREYKADLLDLLASHEPEAGADEPPSPVTTERIRAYRQKYRPASDGEGVGAGQSPQMFNQFAENIEMRDSALFDVIVEVDFYDGRRIQIPQQSTPKGWTAPF